MKTRRDNLDIRKPPKPPHWDAPRGICRLCGEEMLTQAGKRHQARRWCATCGPKWRIANNPDVTRAAVFARDHGVCVDCGTECTSYPAVFGGTD